MQIIIHLICNIGLIGIDFADVATVLSNMQDAIVASGKGKGINRASQAVNHAIKEIEQVWGDLFNPEISGVLVDICVADMSMEEFDVIGNLIYYKFMDTITIQIGTNAVPEYKEQMEVNVLVVKRKMGVRCDV